MVQFRQTLLWSIELELVAHFQKAALLMLHDRLDVAMIRMENGDAESVRAFTRTIRHLNEILLRFTHRCRRHDSSSQSLARDLYRLRAGQLGTAVLDDGVRSEVLPTTGHLDRDQLLRRAG